MTGTITVMYIEITVQPTYINIIHSQLHFVNSESLKKATQFLETKPESSMHTPAIPYYESFQHLVMIKCASYAFRMTTHEVTGNIYVSDSLFNQIQVYSQDALLIKEMRTEVFFFVSAMLAHESSMYVTSFMINVILQFSLDEFQIIKQAGKKGSGMKDFDYPRGMAISPNQQLYVADCNNNRVQILSCNLDFLSSLKHKTMTHPVDVKFSTNQILVLSFTDDPCVHLFTFSGEKTGSIISNGAGMVVCKPSCLCIDACGNILTSDGCIRVFSPEGELMHSIENRFYHGYYYEDITILNHTELVSFSPIQSILCKYSA